MASPEPGGLEFVDSLDLVRHFGFCTPVELNLSTKVLSHQIDLKLWFSTKTIDCNCRKEITVLLMISQDCGGPEIPDSIARVRQLGFCTNKKLKVNTKLLSV